MVEKRLGMESFWSDIKLPYITFKNVEVTWKMNEQNYLFSLFKIPNLCFIFTILQMRVKS